MNKVKERCAKSSCAKFYFASRKMFTELKVVKLLMYALNIVPVIFCFLPSSDQFTKLVCSCVSFTMTLIAEVVSSILTNYKEKAVLSHQLYEAEITGSSFSKTEYDRESTNDVNELAIRKSEPRMRQSKPYPVVVVPQEINDEYSYLYICRLTAARTRYTMSRMFYGYLLALIAIGLVFIGVNFVSPTGEMLYLLVCFWPLIIPIIRNCTSCAKCVRQCVKICADIDNFFADGDASVERLARFHYYVQNIEFEMLVTRPTVFAIIAAMLKPGLDILSEGVTERFKDAILELKNRDLILRGLVPQPKGKQLITRKDVDLETLEKSSAKGKKSAKTSAKGKGTKSAKSDKPTPAPKAPSGKGGAATGSKGSSSTSGKPSAGSKSSAKGSSKGKK